MTTGEGGKGGGGGGGYYLNGCEEDLLFFFFCPAGGRNLVIGEVTPHNFLPLSSHDFVVILNSYVH